MIVMDWLLDSDPAIRWQVMRDLADAPTEVVAAERKRVATEGWGAALLALRGADGQWAGGAYFPGQSGESADAAADPTATTADASAPGAPTTIDATTAVDATATTANASAADATTAADATAAEASGQDDGAKEDGAKEGGAKEDGGEDDSGGSQAQPWTATSHTLRLLCDFGIDPENDEVRRTVALVAENCRWEHDGQAFFDGEVEPCINGMTVVIGAYFGRDVSGIVTRLLGDQLDDGGWNCWTEWGSSRSAFASTINVLEGLLAYERASGGSPELVAARRRGEEYLLDRGLFRRKSTGEVVNEDWLQFSFPPRWHYDILRALDYFRSVGDPPDPRLEEAIDVLRKKRQPDGTWLLDRTHPGAVHFTLEEDGQPSRWNTLRALRVLDWYGHPD